jgi:hypothetical protein
MAASICIAEEQNRDRVKGYLLFTNAELGIGVWKRKEERERERERERDIYPKSTSFRNKLHLHT